MPVPLKSEATFLRDKALEAGMAQSKINTLMRTSAKEVGEWWVKECLHKHFEQRAFNLYNYAPRSSRWTRRKMNAKYAYDINTGQVHPATHPPQPLVWSGSLRDFVLGAKGFYQVKATSKFASGSQRQMVSVAIPIRLNHPINPKNKGELTRISNQERRQMRQMLFDKITARMKPIIGKLLNWRAA